ncbi:MAG: type II toxin-antitoxin system HicA family toxin [Patescibacteria group bacterium]
MSKISPVDYRRLICIFEKEGFVLNRIRGDHSMFTKDGVARPLVIPHYEAVPVFIVKNLLRTAGMSRERYFERLDEC